MVPDPTGDYSGEGDFELTFAARDAGMKKI
jgi:hypothetical protein